MVQTQQATPARTVVVELDARETQWQVAASRTMPGYGFNGQVPGPRSRHPWATRSSSG